MTIRDSRLRKAWKKRNAFRPHRRRLQVEQLEHRLVLAPVFGKVFLPDTIGPGSVSTLQFNITEDEGSPVTDLVFTDTLPAGVTIASPAMASTNCMDGTVSAPDGGTTISLSGGRLGAFQSCSVTVDVTSSTPGLHTNTSGDLTSSAGNSGTATDDLTVDTDRPGFSKSFAPSSLPMGGRSTLTYTIDNSANASALSSLVFTDNLPLGLEIADPANASTTCGGVDPTLTATTGTSVVSFSSIGALYPGFEVLLAGATCSATVDVTATAAGMLDNVTSELMSNVGSSGKASDTLEVTVTPIALAKSFTDDPVPPGGIVDLEFTITNRERADSATDIAFTDNLDAALSGLTFDSLLSNDCGGSVSGEGTGEIGLTGGTVGPGSSCTISTELSVPPGATPGSYTNTTSAIAATLGGSPVTGNQASDDLFVQPVPLLIKEFLEAGTLAPDPVINAGDDVVMSFTIENTSPWSDATDIEFTDELTSFLPFPVTVALPPTPDPPCGDDSSLALISLGPDRQGLSLTGGSLLPAGITGDSCTFDVTLTTPQGLRAGNYTNTTEEITAIVDDMTVTGQPASDDFTVIAAPTLTMSFADDPVVPGGTATLEFALDYPSDSTVDATDIAFTDDLATVLAGLTANLPVAPDPPCGAGSSLTGSAGDTLLTFQGGTLMPGESCTFGVTVDVPAGAAPGSYGNTTSDVSAMFGGQTATSAPAADDLDIAGLTFTKEFLDDPVFPGETTTLRFTVDNVHPTDDATITFFTDSLSSVLPGLAATGGATVNTCGGSLSGTSSLLYSGGSVLSGQSCAIEVDVLVPASAPNGTFANITSSLAATQGGAPVTIDPATDTLIVNSNVLQLTKEFTDDPVAPGDRVTVDFTLTNLDAEQPASGIGFSDDLDEALAGLTFDSLLLNSCRATVSGGGTTDISVSGGSLAPDGACTIRASLSVPDSAAAGIYPNFTSRVTGTIGDFPVTGDAASDELFVNEFLVFSKSFDGPTTAGGTPVLTFTITNPRADAVADLSFSDNLDDVLSGLVATNLPQADVCGPGSLLSGTSFIALTGGNLLGQGATCSFDVDLLVPGDATVGTFPNITSELFQAGLPVAPPATADLTVEEVEPPPMFDKVFAPEQISVIQASTLTFTIDNSASAVDADSLDFTDNLPAGVVVATPPNATTTCTGGMLTATGGSDVITYTGGSVAEGASCTVQVDVGSSVPGIYDNTTGDLTSSSGNSGSASDTLTVVQPPDFSKTFAPEVIAVVDTSTLTFTIDNSANPIDATSLDFTDNLPAGVVVATSPNASTTCTGGTLTATAGSGVIDYSGGSLTEGASCTVQVDVASSMPFSHDNLTGDLTSSLGNSGQASGTLTVVWPPDFSKSFAPHAIAIGGETTLWFQIDNSANPLAATDIVFTDNLPAGVVVATPPNASSTCGGILTADAGTSVITFGGGAAPAESRCEVQVDVTSFAPGHYVNTSGNLTSSLGAGGAAASVLVVVAPLEFSKSFTPNTIDIGGLSALSFTIDNTVNSLAVDGLDFTDNLPAGVVVADPPNATTDCSGGTLTAASGSGVITYTGGTVDARSICTVDVDVTSDAAGTHENTTGDLTSSAGVSGTASDTLTVIAETNFNKLFAPENIGPGSVSTLIFTIDNSENEEPVDGLDFTDNLPAGVTIASPANAVSTCDGILSAPDGGGTISFNDGDVGAERACMITVDVTSSILGTHTNVTGDLTSSVGNLGSASADLTVDANLPGFTKSFSPDSISRGGRSTLIFTIDNTANSSAAVNLDFTDNLPSGIVVADPPNAQTDCTGGVLVATGGSNVITYGPDYFGDASVSAESSCAVSVDVIGSSVGLLGNTTGELTSGEEPVSSGKASDTLEVTVDPISLVKSFTDDPVAPGGTVTAEFTITNFDRGNGATDIAFTDNLDATLSGLVATGLPANDICGAGSVLSGTSVLTFSGGNLPSGGSCTFSATLEVPVGASPGTYPNTTSEITAEVGGMTVTGGPGTDDLFVQTAPGLAKNFSDDAVAAGGTTDLEFTITNTSTTSDATDITFTDDLDSVRSGLVAIGLPAAEVCGPGSVLDGTSVLTLTGGNLGPEGVCTFPVNLEVPVGAPGGEFVNVTSDITATVNDQTLTGDPASDSLIVVTAPRLTKSFTDDPVLPGGTATLEFTLTYGEEAAGDATGIGFTDNLDDVLAGLVATGLPVPDVCGAGSVLSGTSLLTLTDGNLAPGESCTFTVPVDVPGTAPLGYHTNTTSSVTATIAGLTATGLPAEDDLLVTPLTFTKSFIDGPALPGGTVTLQFSLDNASQTSDVWDISFTDDLDDTLSGLVAIGLPMANMCGAGSQITGTSSLVFTGGNLGPEESCTFDVTLDVPAGAASGTYRNTTSDGVATIDDTRIDLEPATDALTVSVDQLLLSKFFTDDPVSPGAEVTLEFELTNLNESQGATSISFTDDLDTALSGLVAVGLPASDVCGAGSTLSGTSVLTLSGGNLGPDASCTFNATLHVPTMVAPGTATNWTSQVMGTMGGLEVTGQPARDDLQVVLTEFTKVFDDETPPGGTPTLTFTIENLDTTAGVSDIAFSDDLDSVLSGLVATGLPAADVCGAGSVLSGTSILTMTGGGLGPGASCTIDVPLQVPTTASPGDYINTTSDLFAGGVPVGVPASDTLVVTGLGLTGGPLTPGPNLFPIAGGTPDGISILVQGTQPGSQVLTVQGIQLTTAFADPVVIAFAEADANGVATPVPHIPASQIGQTLSFQAFQILPTVLQSGVLSLVVTAGPMLAESGEGPGAAPVARDVLPPLIDEAIQRWESTGLTPEQADRIRSAEFQLVDLPDGLLGDTFEGTVSIDVTAAGYGWFVDSTPVDDSEFHYFIGGDEVRAVGGIAAAQMDLLTVVMHELGHVLGFADLSNSVVPYDLMTQTLATSARRIPDGSNPSWHNPVRPENVNNDQGVTPLDALALIDDINKHGIRSLPQSPEGTNLSPPYLDVSGDKAITAHDVLEVITYLQRQTLAKEGESPAVGDVAGNSAQEIIPATTLLPPVVSPAGNVKRLEFETHQSTQDLSKQSGPADWAELETDDAALERGRIPDASAGNVDPDERLDGEFGLAEVITDIAEDVLSAWQPG